MENMRVGHVLKGQNVRREHIFYRKCEGGHVFYLKTCGRPTFFKKRLRGTFLEFFVFFSLHTSHPSILIMDLHILLLLMLCEPSFNCLYIETHHHLFFYQIFSPFMANFRSLIFYNPFP